MLACFFIDCNDNVFDFLKNRLLYRNIYNVNMLILLCWRKVQAILK